MFILALGTEPGALCTLVKYSELETFPAISLVLPFESKFSLVIQIGCELKLETRQPLKPMSLLPLLPAWLLSLRTRALGTASFPQACCVV